MWANEPAFILGGGPSMRKHEKLGRIQGKGHIIAVNRALELPVLPDIWMWIDPPFYKWVMTGQLGPHMLYKATVYPNMRVTRTSNHAVKPEDNCNCDTCLMVRNWPDNITRMHWQGGRELGPSIAEKVNVGTNSGFWALNIAYCAGADPIILLGIDCNGNAAGEQTWWHPGYPRKIGSASAYKRMRESFENAGRRMAEEKRTIWNASPGSSVRSIEVIDLDTALRRLAALEQRAHAV
jgi:hypothetical protein